MEWFVITLFPPLCRLWLVYGTVRQVLMLVPTRELALQTSAIVKEIGKHTGVQCMVRACWPINGLVGTSVADPMKFRSLFEQR